MIILVVLVLIYLAIGAALGTFILNAAVRAFGERLRFSRETVLFIAGTAFTWLPDVFKARKLARAERERIK